MALSTRHLFLCTAALCAAAVLSGCATRYDAAGRQIYVWQFGQDTDTSIDYSNPRLPLLPRSRPLDNQLWEIPSPYEFNDLSRYSMLKETPEATSDQRPSNARIGDNLRCGGPCESNALGVSLAARADVRGAGVSAANN